MSMYYKFWSSGSTTGKWQNIYEVELVRNSQVTGAIDLKGIVDFSPFLFCIMVMW